MGSLYACIDEVFNPAYNPFLPRGNDNIEDAEVISDECYDLYQSAIVGVTDDDMRTMAALLDDAESEPQLEFSGDYSRGEGSLRCCMSLSASRSMPSAA